ncbi:uncharacterized protein LOC123322369 [Coccinella septempunctata]|uniref:uncharacterized protein LOC123322369 n=1 Tax=Coccinella septempunctata TaxID=41139 RepID=UPI001D097C75|nr:uncharacterized protein LOC123322369 [Coccinella septempunctata]
MSSDEEPSTSAPSAKRRKYQQFYKKEWEEEFPGWLQVGRKGINSAYCKICNKDINIASGKDALRKHSSSQGHLASSKSLKAQPKISSFTVAKNPIPEIQVKQGEIRLASFVAEHNLPFTIMEHLPKLIQAVCPDSKIAKDLKCSTTKTHAIVDNVLVLQAVVGPNYRFICIDVGAYGKQSDSGIFDLSNLNELLQRGALKVHSEEKLPGSDLRAPHVIIGDEDYPLKPYLMRPYPDRTAGPDEHMFNKRLFLAKQTVAFGIISNEWRILLKAIGYSTTSRYSNPSIISIAEHWCEDINLSVMSIPGFKLVSSFCRSSREHGGTAIFARSRLQVTNMDISRFSVEMECEFCAWVLTSRTRPAYVDKIPGRKKLSTTLLKKCYQECIDGARRRVNSDAVILCDGWKNSSSNTKTVVTMLHSTDGKSGFIDARDLTTESETAEKLAEIIMESTTIVKEKYNVDVYAVVSDNASAMVEMGSLIRHRMWHSTCNCHTGNLLAKDILDKKLVDNVVLVLKEFKQSDFEKMIISKGGRIIKLPAETRWCSYRDSFKSLIEILPYIKQILAATRKKIKPKVIELIFNDDFIDEVQKNFDIQNPICNLINTCQSAEMSLVDAVNLWLTLKVPEIFVEKLKNRQEIALNVYALTAYFLHPTYDISKLTSAYTIKINAFLFKLLDNKGIEEWDKFNTRSGMLHKYSKLSLVLSTPNQHIQILFHKKANKPLVFWRMAQMECPVLGSLALKLLKIPASSAQLERLFSNWGYIHTPLRNRLSFEHSKMLVHLYFTLQSDNIEENLDPDSASSLTSDVED